MPQETESGNLVGIWPLNPNQIRINLELILATGNQCYAEILHSTVGRMETINIKRKRARIFLFNALWTLYVYGTSTGKIFLSRTRSLSTCVLIWSMQASVSNLIHTSQSSVSTIEEKYNNWGNTPQASGNCMLFTEKIHYFLSINLLTQYPRYYDIKRRHFVAKLNSWFVMISDFSDKT